MANPFKVTNVPVPKPPKVSMATSHAGPFGSGIKLPKAKTTGIGPLKESKPVSIKANTVHNVTFHAPHFSKPLDSTLKPSKAATPKMSSFPSISAPTAVQGSTGGSGGGGGIFGEIEHGVTGFISHLSSDAVNMAMGFPVGIAYMIQHPIAGAEGAVKATWQDWSPLFEGHPDEFLHNFYMHPLAPLLDIAGAVTGGAAIAARTAGAVGEVGAAADAADAAAVAARGTTSSAARLLNSADPAEQARGVEMAAKDAVRAGKSGARATEGWQKALKFSNPRKFAFGTHFRTAIRLGYNEADATAFARDALQHDPFAQRLFIDKETGVTRAKAISTNPAVRARENLASKMANAAASRSEVLDKVIGDNATFKKLGAADKGIRKAASRQLIYRELGGLKKLGESNAQLSAFEKFGVFKNSMREGLVTQADVVEPAASGAPADLTAQAQKLVQAGHMFIKANPDESAIADALNKEGDAAFERVLGANGSKSLWASAHTTTDWQEALKGADGNYRVVSRTHAGNIAQETDGALKVVKAMYNKPTQIWRYAMLGLSPRYFVNNFVGNSVMLMAATDPVSFAGAMLDHLRTIHGINAEQASLDEIAKVSSGIKGTGYMDQYYAGEYGMSRSIQADASGMEKAMNKVSIHNFVNKHADMPQRYMAINYTMKRMPEYQAEYSRLIRSGMGKFEAQEKAGAFASKSFAVRQLVRTQVNHMLGQYHTFTDFEKGVRKVVPFYAWDRAIVSHMRMLITQEPYKVAMASAIGLQGNKKLADMIGQTPDFLKSMIPGGMLGGIIGNDPGRIGALNASSLSPYGSIGSLADTIGSLLGGQSQSAGPTADNIGGQLNPILQGAISGMAGGKTAPTLGPIKGPCRWRPRRAIANIPQIQPGEECSLRSE